MHVSSYAAAVTPSATLAAGAKARELKAAGVDVLDFSLGEPDFPTPPHICEAAVQAMKAGHTRYTPAAGVPALRQAVADYHRKQHGLDYKPNQVVVSNGCKHAIYTALCAILEPGDEVVFGAPFWVSYVDMVKMAGGVPKAIATPAAGGFKLTPDLLRAACTPRTKLLMLNSPSNPTGTTYTPAELAALAKIVVEKDLLVLSDEIYERLIYGDVAFQAFASLGPELYARTLTVNGVSKTYAMTGWRIGWTCGPADVIAAMDGIQSQQSGNPCSVSQYAAIAALNGDQGCVEEMKMEFARRCSYVCDRLPTLPGVVLPKPTGAFYAFFDVSRHFGKTFGGMKVENSTQFCLGALAQAHVNLVPGSAFGQEGFVRMSFATGMPVIEKGLDALEAWLKAAS
ncbi:MAG: pyridoxal phosphate-dependent aminotransferase [Planctomycetia bacterium]